MTRDAPSSVADMLSFIQGKMRVRLKAPFRPACSALSGPSPTAVLPHVGDWWRSALFAEGRLVAGALMIVGIGFIGVFTATLTSFFLEPTRVAEEQQNIDDRLARIEAKLDALAQQ